MLILKMLTVSVTGHRKLLFRLLLWTARTNGGRLVLSHSLALSLSLSLSLALSRSLPRSSLRLRAMYGHGEGGVWIRRCRRPLGFLDCCVPRASVIGTLGQLAWLQHRRIAQALQLFRSLFFLVFGALADGAQMSGDSTYILYVNRKKGAYELCVDLSKGWEIANFAAWFFFFFFFFHHGDFCSPGRYFFFFCLLLDCLMGEWRKSAT